MGKLSCYHICYDEETKLSCPAGFTPLHHGNNFARFNEIMPIFERLQTHSWEDGEFVGFFSPRFSEKTGLAPSSVKAAYHDMGDTFDAIFFSSFLDKACYFLNPWEQGDYFNPGLLVASQRLCSHAGFDLDLTNQVCTIDNTVFSHYLIAKKPFWDAWCVLVLKYFELAEADPVLSGARVPYKDSMHSIHPFVVERFPTLIALTTALKTTQYLDSLNAYLENDSVGRRSDIDKKNQLKFSLFLDNQKRLHLETNDQKYLDSYWAHRIRYAHGSRSHTKTALNYLRRSEVEVWSKGSRVNGVEAS